jgi:hypothetical protein
MAAPFRRVYPPPERGHFRNLFQTYFLPEFRRVVQQTQEGSIPVLFNRGMSALFLGRAADAHTALTQATAQLPVTSAWHHLGRLYLALSEARR